MSLRETDFGAWCRLQALETEHTCRICGAKGNANKEDWIDWDVCFRHYSIDSDSLWSSGQSGDGSGGGEEEADEASPAGRPLGVSPKIHGGKTEDLDPGLRDILKHTLIPCVQCRTEMGWVDGSHEFGELRLECPECHWATCITNPKLMAVYKHRKQST